MNFTFRPTQRQSAPRTKKWLQNWGTFEMKKYI